MLAVSPAMAETCEKVSYGAGVTLTETTAVAAILDQPAAFVGKEVRVEGDGQGGLRDGRLLDGDLRRATAPGVSR